LLSKPINPERLFKHLARHLAAPGH
jgi:hypothetical protein